jgi:hypothetical protein
MVERFEEDLGKFAFINIDQVKDYLSISSNTQDARLSNIISYATGVVEHYIGQEVLANDYVEIFDGGKSAIFTSRLPLSNVYEVVEFNGSERITLADPTTIGGHIQTSSQNINLITKNNAKLTTRVKKFGTSSLVLAEDDYIVSFEVPETLQFEESNFTIEMFVRVDEPTLQDNALVTFNTDASNYMQFRLANQVGLAFEANIQGNTTLITGANSNIESEQFAKRRWAHVAVTRNLEEEKIYLHYNGNTIAQAAFAESNLTFTANIEIGTTFKGYIDEMRISSIARYSDDFTPTNFRYRPDDDTVLLIHFDGKNKSTDIKDAHSAPNDFVFARDTGEITKYIGSIGTSGKYPISTNKYPSLSLFGPSAFAPYPGAITVTYRAGYEPNDVPLDLQMATLDFIKLIYKQQQDKKGFSFEGESGDKFPLVGNFPPHVRRILDLYRIIS